MTRMYACPRCFVIVPVLTEVIVSEGLTEHAPMYACDECLDDLRAHALIDLGVLIHPTGRVRGERVVAPLRKVG